MASLISGFTRSFSSFMQYFNKTDAGAERESKVSQVSPVEEERFWKYDAETKTLSIKDTHIETAKVNAILVEHAGKVDQLAINCLQLRNLIGLEAHPRITALNLEGCKQLESLRGLEKCKNLATLVLSHNYNIKDFSPIGELAHLKSLSVSDMPYFADKDGRLTFLAKFQNLTLTIEGCAVKESTQALKPLKRSSTIRIARSVV